jgi:F-type H+-transporting ATPase subunit b
MSQLFSQLGIDWRLLLSQAVNFLLLLVILRIFVYKPLLKLLHDRRAKIEEGLMKAKMADERLHEVDEIGKGKIKEAEATAVGILKKTEVDAKTLEAKLLAEANRKEAEAVKNTEAILRAKEEESRRAMEKEAMVLVRQAIVKTVELSPSAIDDALISRAVKEARASNQRPVTSH